MAPTPHFIHCFSIRVKKISFRNDIRIKSCVVSDLDFYIFELKLSRFVNSIANVNKKLTIANGTERLIFNLHNI